MIQQISILPARPLRPYIKEYQWMGSPLLLEEWVEEAALPVPVSGLCFQFIRKRRLLVTHERMEREALPPTYILPPNTRPFTIHYGGGLQLLAVIFRPAAFYEFFGWPLLEFTDRTVALGDTAGRQGFADLYSQLEENAPLQEKLKALNRFFLQKLKRVTPANPRIRQALKLIAQDGKPLRSSVLASEIGIGQRHLQRLFNEYLGMPPRDFLRIYRFYRAYWALLAGQYENLTKLALNAGYYDQAHFIHDFRDFTGLPPLQFLERDFAILNKIAWKNGKS